MARPRPLCSNCPCAGRNSVPGIKSRTSGACSSNEVALAAVSEGRS
jgi:hypothetical protein